MTFQAGPIQARTREFMSDFDLEVSFGLPWISLNDQVNFRVSAEDLGTAAQQRRRITATSPYYDGTFYVHSTLENITEGLTIYVMGVSQNHVTENLLLLRDIFDQDTYNIRLRMDDHMETWSCQPADYSIDRTHVNAHNVRAVMKLQIPRLPKVSYEVVL